MPIEGRLKRILPERMWQLRNRRGLTIDAIAQLTGLSKSTVCQLEGGQSPNPYLLTVDLVGRCLSTTPDGLLGYNVMGYNGEPVTLHLADRCCQCGILLLPGRAHLSGGGECILEAWHAGTDVEQLAIKFGHTTASIGVILAEEVDLRRRKPQVPIFTTAVRPFMATAVVLLVGLLIPAREALLRPAVRTRPAAVHSTSRRTGRRMGSAAAVHRRAATTQRTQAV